MTGRKGDGLAARASGLGARAYWWMLAPLAFVMIMVLQLCFPVPQGPSDSGDFHRIAMAFSTGPAGFPMFPTADDPARQERFLTYYHRYWRLDAWTRPLASSAALIVLPTAWAMRSAGLAYFDLALHTCAVLVGLGCALAWTFWRLRDCRAVASLTVLAFVPFSDPVVAGYVNSLYQESGTYVVLLLLLAAGHLLWERTTWPRWISVTMLAVLLMATKPAYTHSVGLAVTPLLLIAGLRGLASPAWRWVALALAGAALMGLLTILIFRVVNVSDYEKCHSYNFVFTGALPRLPAVDRGRYLRALDLEESLVELNGIAYFEAGSRYEDPRINALLGWKLHRRAVVELITAHPGAAARLFHDAMAASGAYWVPWLGYRERQFSGTLQQPSGLTLWSTWRARWLSGTTAYALGGVLLLFLLVGSHLSGWHGWPVFSLIVGGGFYCASLSQLAISVVGDGATDLIKHNYFANLLLDCTLVLSAVGIVVAVMSRRRVGDTRRNTVDEAMAVS